jgi:Flp pilus assembly protein TadD
VSQALRRSAILSVLLAGYATLFVQLPGWGGRSGSFDPLSPRGRQVEQGIETGQFAEALPVALDLQRASPREPLLAYWLAEIYRGLDRAGDEAQAWESYVALAVAPEAACPALGEAYARLGEHTTSLRAYERCAAWEPENPERLIDLAAALERQGHANVAADAYRRAAALDPSNPRVGSRIQALDRAGHAR